ncbi:MAG: Fur family transcriptional regulator [Alphaproteobacteria bacterium]
MSETLFPELEHDHRICIDQGINRAKQICSREGVKFTMLRENVLRELLASHQALGAYEIIERLSKQGRKLSPISVYRIIDVLLAVGLVRRLESKNAFFACHLQHDHVNSVVVLVCHQCNRVVETEVPEAEQAIQALTKANNFAISNTVFEVHGSCRDCLGT